MTLQPDQAMLSLFWGFVKERHAIYRRRFEQGLPPPWTTDPILSRYHFTNVYRELDRGTLVLKAMLVKCPGDLSRFYSLLVYRVMNNVEAWASLMAFLGNEKGPAAYLDYQKHTPENILSWAQERHRAHQTVFSDGAHRAPVVKGQPGVPLTLYAVASDIYAHLEHNLDEVRQAKGMEDLYQLALSIDGLGEFYAMEIAEDIMQSGLAPFNTEGNWTHAGPGCRAMLDRIFPGQLSRRVGVYEDAVRWMQFHQPSCSELELPKLLTLRNIEHSLCEGNKFCKLRFDGIKPRRVHRPDPSPLPTLKVLA